MPKRQSNSKSKKDSDYEDEGQDLDDAEQVSEEKSSAEIEEESPDESENEESEESPPIEAAIKTMTFRANRGSKMKDLITGKIDRDDFWDKNKMFFGGDLRGRDLDEFESDYEASSSGRDEFDSDFDQTDSYPGKRGRKKGQKSKKRIVRESSGRPRGRPRKVKADDDEAEEQKEEKSKSQKKLEKKSKKIYKEVPFKSSDEFVIYKAVSQKKTNKPQKKDSEKCEKKPLEVEIQDE